MTDPWADERADIEQWTCPDNIATANAFVLAIGNTERLNSGLGVMRGDLRRVLDDADALLALREYANHKRSCELPEQGVRGICDCGFTQTLAALPEHLK